MTAVLRADALRLPLRDESVDLIVTSPPYFALRSYRDGEEHYAGQIGSEDTPQAFLEALWAVTAECVRVLKPSGSMFVNLGDKYASGHGGSSTEGNGVTLHKRVAEAARPKERPDLPNPPGSWSTRDATGRNVVPGFRPKTLMGMPWRYALGCIDRLGLILRGELIWSKPNGLPESVTDRVRRSHETWFHFTRLPRYFSAVDEIREPYDPATARRYESGFGIRSREEHESTKGYTNADGGPSSVNPLGKLPGSVWTIASEPLQVPDWLGVDHFAAFPQEWPRRLILGWSPSGICVECGEGLRPSVSKEGQRPVARAHRHLPGYEDPAGEGVRDMSYTIGGYECACPEPWTLNDVLSARSPSSAGGTAPTTPSAASTAITTSATPTTRTSRRRRLRPAVILDPFGGTGTTAMVARALGRTGISVDLSADYCRLARWRIFQSGHAAKARERTNREAQGALL